MRTLFYLLSTILAWIVTARHHNFISSSISPTLFFGSFLAWIPQPTSTFLHLDQVSHSTFECPQNSFPPISNPTHYLCSLEAQPHSPFSRPRQRRDSCIIELPRSTCMHTVFLPLFVACSRFVSSRFGCRVLLLLVSSLLVVGSYTLTYTLITVTHSLSHLPPSLGHSLTR